MAIIENFYNGDRARNIREILTQNFANVAKYIPNNFISLTSIERQNLTDDYKTHFKLVFDKEQEYVYRWSEVERNWKQYLIRAKDEYARAEVNANSETAFTDAQIGIDINGKTNPYTITFYNRDYTDQDGVAHSKVAKDSVFLTAANIKYNDTYSTQKIIEKIIADLTSLDEFVGDRSVFLNNSDIIATTVTGALNEINQKTIDNKSRLDNIMDGITVVPKAQHANEADHALDADMADDSQKLGGQFPSYYATQDELTATNTTLDNTIKRVTTNEGNIADLQEGLQKTNTNVTNLTKRVDENKTDINQLYANQATQSEEIEELVASMSDIASQIGWEMLLT